MKRFLILIAMLLLVGENAIAASAETAEAIYAKAYSQLYKNNTKSAISTFTRGIHSYPDCAFLYAGMGDAYRKEENYTKALEYYTQAQQKKNAIDNYKIDFYSTKLEKDNQNIRNAVIELFEASKDVDYQLLFKNINMIMDEKYTQTVLLTEIYQNTSNSEINRANQLKKSGQNDAALKIYLKVLSSNPQNFQAANNAGAALIDLRDYILARKYLEQADSISPNSSIILNNLALVNLYQRRYSEMEKTLEKMRKESFVEKNNAAVINVQAAASYYQSQNIESIIDIIKSDTTNYYAARTLAEIYFIKENFDNANKILEPLESGYNFKLYMQKAYTALKTSNNSAALTYINKAITMYSDSSYEYEIRGRIYYAMGRYQEAIADFKTALAKDKKNENVYYYYARALNKAGDSVGATNMMRNFVSLKKGNPQTSFLKILFE
ncbi:MAG: tetratricopeptide repeat protein [bacterium]|nr:tetratricopeptide repeat protein [bacterium]